MIQKPEGKWSHDMYSGRFSFLPDKIGAFCYWFRIRIQFGSRILMTKKIGKKLFQGIQKGHPSYRRSLLLSEENIKHFKT
jgi:hypothetical protein